jgi:hypothetical protein
MTDAPTLLALAERCERADADEESAVFHEVGHALWQAGDITGEERARWTALIDIGACIVIAMGLVPEGWRVQRLKEEVRNLGWGDKEWSWSAGLWLPGSVSGRLDSFVEAGGPTAAGTLTAAALRARAAMGVG